MVSGVIFAGISTVIIFSPFILVGGSMLVVTCFQLLVLFCLGFYLFNIENDKLVLKRTFLDWYIFLYFIFACLSFILSKTPYNTRNELFNLGAYIGLFYLTLFFIDESKPQKQRLQVKNLISLIIGVGVVISFVGIGQFIKGEPVNVMMMNSNVLAGYLIMIIPLLISRVIIILKNHKFFESYPNLYSLKSLLNNMRFFLSFGNKNLVLMSYLVFLAIMIACLTFTFSLGAWIGLSFGLSLFLFLGLKGNFNKKFWYIIMGGGLLLIYSVIYKFIYHDIIFNRLNWWRGAWKMMCDYSFTGVGLGCFGSVYLKYKTGHLNSLYAHNYFLQIAAEIGVAGLVVFLCMLTSFFKNGIKQVLIYYNKSDFDNLHRVETQRIDSQGIFLNMGILSGLAAVLVQNVFEYNLFVSANAILFWVLLGVSCSLQNNLNYWQIILKNVSKWWWKIVLMVLVVNLMIIIGKPLLASRYYVLGESFLEEKEFKEAEISFKKAIKLNSLWAYAYWGLARSYLNFNQKKKDKCLPTLLEKNDEEAGKFLPISKKEIQLKLL
ncbi:O-antigen ligase family protein, partial [bacterium]|nr:O-antigen ligase family protein [bacterium]